MAISRASCPDKKLCAPARDGFGSDARCTAGCILIGDVVLPALSAYSFPEAFFPLSPFSPSPARLPDAQGSSGCVLRWWSWLACLAESW